MIPRSEVQDLDTAVGEAVGLTIEEAVRNVARHEERRLAHLFHQQMKQHI
jgi:hypothetical protein